MSSSEGVGTQDETSAEGAEGGGIEHTGIEHSGIEHSGVEHGGVQDLPGLVRQLLEVARDSSARRASRTLITVGGLRVTLIVLGADGSLAEHENPGAATLQVITGTVVLQGQGRQWRLEAGSLAQIPDERHGLHAETDAAVLLTVALQSSDRVPLVG